MLATCQGFPIRYSTRFLRDGLRFAHEARSVRPRCGGLPAKAGVGTFGVAVLAPGRERVKPDGNQISEKLVRRARSGAGLLGSAVRSNSANELRRAMRAATYAKALKSVRADAAFALQSPRPDVRLFCLAAVAAVQSRPLLQAAMFSTGIDGNARVALLRTFEKEPRLLAAVDLIVLRRREELRQTGL